MTSPSLLLDKTVRPVIFADELLVCFSSVNHYQVVLTFVLHEWFVLRTSVSEFLSCFLMIQVHFLSDSPLCLQDSAGTSFLVTSSWRAAVGPVVSVNCEVPKIAEFTQGEAIFRLNSFIQTIEHRKTGFVGQRKFVSCPAE